MTGPGRRLSEMTDLSGRVALVTGGTGHIGYQAAAALAELGAKVALVDREQDPAKAKDLTELFGTDCVSLAVDLADEPLVRALPGQVVHALGGLDIVVTAAAFVGTSNLEGWVTSFDKQSADTWRQALEVNLTSVFVLCQAALPVLKHSGKGSIVNIASTYGVVGPDMGLYEGTAMGNPAAYGASKGGLLQFTRWLSTVAAPEVRVNAVSPGGIARGQPEAFVKRYEERTPLGRLGTEDDVKGAIAFLAGDAAAYVTGQNIVIDGGWTAW